MSGAISWRPPTIVLIGSGPSEREAVLSALSDIEDLSGADMRGSQPVLTTCATPQEAFRLFDRARASGLGAPLVVVATTLDPSQEVAFLRRGARDVILTSRLARLTHLIEEEIRVQTEVPGRLSLLESTRAEIELPLNQIESQTRRLVEELDYTPGSVVPERLAAIGRAGERVRELLGQLPELVALSNRDGRRDAGSIEILPILRETLSSCQAQAGTRELMIEAEPGLHAWVDAPYLGLALRTLLGAALRCAGPAGWITLGSYHDGTTGRITITDGTTLGSRGSQGHSVIDRTEMQWGLALGGRLIAATGGAMTMGSRMGRSVISIDLPLATPKRSPRPTSSDQRSGARSLRGNTARESDSSRSGSVAGDEGWGPQGDGVPESRGALGFPKTAPAIAI
ncbi:MAG TPA: ATP-binding protein [Candidatus Dormibacteraeota bacterium]|jgi:hypothetical protein|nr:ATP-binding protein [Candidatus Dormibacteraeota bacterium]